MRACAAAPRLGFVTESSVGTLGVTRASGHHTPVVLDLLGRRVRVDAGGHPATAQVEALWSRCRPAHDPTVATHDPHLEEPPSVISLSRTDRPLAPQQTIELRDALREAAVGAAEDRLLLLRTAAVATPGGAVLGLVAPTAELRATSAAELSRRGFGYVTDELLALDESFDVLAFPEPLAFDRPEEDVPMLAGPDALGMRPSAHALHLSAMVMLERDPRQRKPQLVPVPREHDVRLLEPTVVSAPASWAETALPDLVDEVDGLWVLKYAEIHLAAPLLAELLAQRTRPASGPIELYVAVGITDDKSPRQPTVSGHDLALDGLRRTVWQSAAGGATLEALHTAANLELGGPHHISVQLVAAAVRDLMALGLLVPETGRPRGGDIVAGVPGSRR